MPLGEVTDVADAPQWSLVRSDIRGKFLAPALEVKLLRSFFSKRLDHGAKRIFSRDACKRGIVRSLGSSEI